MEHSKLTALIHSLEYGTKLHISIVFLGHYGNKETQLPPEQRIHTCPVCDTAKKTPEGFAACFRCRNTVLKWCIRHKRSFGGYCVKGVYEYCHPVVRGTEVPAVIFIGNILTGNPQQQHTLNKYVDQNLLQTMQADFTRQDCARTAGVLESYILFLLDRYGNTMEASTDALMENIKHYITENMLFEFSMADLSAVFNYNEKYLCRLFKEKNGRSIKEYCNTSKVEKAKNLIKSSNLRISEVATQSGFNNVTYFNRIFKKLTGLSPQEYRTRR